MPSDDVEQAPVNDHVTLFDARSTPDAPTEALTRHLELLGLQANLLSPVLELNPRVTWVDSLGYLNFFSGPGGGWSLFGENGWADRFTTQNEPLWSLEIWFTNLNPALYLLVVEVEARGPLGPSPRFIFRGPAGTVQNVNVPPAAGRQYLGTLFGPSGTGLDLFTVQTFNLQGYGFFRATLVDVFG